MEHAENLSADAAQEAQAESAPGRAMRVAAALQNYVFHTFQVKSLHITHEQVKSAFRRMGNIMWPYAPSPYLTSLPIRRFTNA